MNTLDIVKKHDFKFIKNLGQNFLIDENVIGKIISEMKINKEETVIEIGPGASALTKHLCEKCKKVIAIEIDKDLVKILKDELQCYDNIEIIHSDFLKINLNDLIKDENVKIVGNLPYYITSDIFYKILKEDINFDTFTVMVQKEVCDKILSKPKLKQYTPLSVFMQYFFSIHIVDIISKESFYPPPKVTSAVLSLKPKNIGKTIDKKGFMDFVLNSFKMRRKTLRNNIKSYFNDESSLIDTFKSLNIGLNSRAEELEIEDFYNLFNALL